MAGRLVVSFAAGLVGFLSPCVLPLLPAYAAYMTGAGSAERVPWRRALPGTLAFVAGLTLVFVSLGAGASSISRFLTEPGNRRALELGSGAFMIVLGTLMTLQRHLPLLMRERRFHVRPGRGGWRTFLLGAAFAFGWTPCIGFTLGAALTLAGTSEGLYEGVALLTAYSLGIGLPFVAVGLGLVRVGAGVKRHAGTIQAVGGLVMIAAGALIVTGRLPQITIWMQQLLDRAGLDFWNF